MLAFELQERGRRREDSGRCHQHVRRVDEPQHGLRLGGALPTEAIDRGIFGQLAHARSLGVNYLLGIGPKPDGDLEPAAYANMAILADWMKDHGAAITGAAALPDGERAFRVPSLHGSPRPASLTLMRDGSPLPYTFADALMVTFPAAKRTPLVDVVRVALPPVKR